MYASALTLGETKCVAIVFGQCCGCRIISFHSHVALEPAHRFDSMLPHQLINSRTLIASSHAKASSQSFILDVSVAIQFGQLIKLRLSFVRLPTRKLIGSQANAQNRFDSFELQFPGPIDPYPSTVFARATHIAANLIPRIACSHSTCLLYRWVKRN